MAYDTRFGPRAQTPAQRAGMLVQMQEALPSPKANGAWRLYARYVAGELSWLAVYEVLHPSS